MKKYVNYKHLETRGKYKGRMAYYCNHMSAREYTKNDFMRYGHPDILIISQAPHWCPFNQKKAKNEKGSE